MEVTGSWQPKYEVGYRYTNKQGYDCEIIELVSELEMYVLQVVIDADKGFTCLINEEGIKQDTSDE